MWKRTPKKLRRNTYLPATDTMATRCYSRERFSKANLSRLWLPLSPSFVQMLERWESMVRGLRSRSSAISLVVRSDAMSLRTRRSARVRASKPGT